MTETLLSTTTSRGRYYEWGGERFVSVTTALSGGIPKPGLNKWMLRQVAKVAADNRAEIAQMDSAADAQKKILDLHYSTPRNEAALLGSRIHKFSEWVAKSMPFEDQPSEQEAKYVEAFMEFYSDWSPEYIESEATVFSRKYGYAGTMDAQLRIDGKVYVVDIKSGKSVWPEAALQCAAYRYADFIGRPSSGSETPLAPSDGALVLHLTPTGYNIIPVDSGPATFDTFLSALDIWRWDNVDKDGVIKEPWTKERNED